MDLETVRWDELFPEDRREDGNRSNVEFEKQRNTLSHEANKTTKTEPNKESQIITHPEIELSKQRTETSLTLKLAQKKIEKHELEEKFDRLYDVLAPGSSVIKTDDYTSIIKGPRIREVTICNSDLTKEDKMIRHRHITDDTGCVSSVH